MKTVITAAIRTETGALYRGKHHENIEAKGAKGFVLSDGSFTDRRNAAKVAVAAGQCAPQVRVLKSHQLKGNKKK